MTHEGCVFSHSGEIFSWQKYPKSNAPQSSEWCFSARIRFMNCDLLLGGGNISNPAADCNQDNSVKIGDVSALINYLLNGTWN